MTEREHGVVIAGGGPTGLMLAGELALAGVDVVIVERRANQKLDGLRAAGLHARTLEVLDQRGLVERFIAEGKLGQKIPALSGQIIDISDLPTRHNHVLALWQNRTEELLAEWVEGLKVETHRACEVTDFTQDARGVRIALSDGRALRAGYLVGCDGGRSLVRKKAGIDFVGTEPSVSYLIAECEMTETPPYGLRHGPRGVQAIGTLEDGRVRLVQSEEQLESGEPTLEDVRRVLVAAYGTDFGLVRADYISRFTDMARQAATYRSGRVLLVGDAAHVHSPAGGQGLNLGVQDAVNLGWKLAQVVHRKASEALLDSYHDERHPVGARVLRNTLAHTALSRGETRIDALRETLSELFDVNELRKRYAAMACSLDIHYPLGSGHPLLGRRMPDLTLESGERVFTLLHAAQPVLLNFAGPPIAVAANVRVVDARYAGPWELPAIGEVSAPAAVLVRPDGHVAWVGDGSEDGLREALATWCGA